MADQNPEIVTGPPGQPGEFIQRPAKLLRIASMIRELLRRRGLPPGAPEAERRPGQYL